MRTPALPHPPLPRFLAGLKDATTGSPDTPLVLLGNFSVEDAWARGESGLPGPAVPPGRAAAALVRHMDELALLLGGPADHVVLSTAPDPDFLAHLAEAGAELPTILTTAPTTTDGGSSTGNGTGTGVGAGTATAGVTDAALADPALLDRLRALGAAGARLLPHGVSADEERLAAATGLTVAGAGAATAKAVNGKVYSRRLADELGIRQARGWECETVDEFAAAARRAAAVLDAGGRIGVKDAYGVSGKGIAVLDRTDRLDRLVRAAARRAERTGDDRIALVVEEWADKRTDLAVHATLHRDGGVRVDFVKESLIENGVSRGHRMPARITPAHLDELRRCAEAVGKRLAADGYHGVFGIDALTERDGGLLPLVEINARNTLATYQTRLHELLLDEAPPGTTTMARQYELRLTEPLGFAELRSHLAELLHVPGRPGGLLVHGYATVNAAAPARDGRGAGLPFTGRLHALAVASTQPELDALDAAVTARLAAATQGAHR